MAERPENQRILALLEALDVELLTREECWLGGGAAVGLRCGEFRLSRYVDFLCSSVAGYRALRERVFDRGAAGLFREPVVLARELRADRYGVRFAVLADGAPLKIEFVREGRVDVHGLTDAGLPVSRLCDEDLVVEKLLANEDRHLDDASLGRDAIDLVLLEHTLGGLPERAWEKARKAYGSAVDRAWQRSLLRLRARRADLPAWLDKMSVLPEARLILMARLEQLPSQGDDGDRSDEIAAPSEELPAT